MKKIIQILLCAFLVSASAFSLDFGILVTDNTDFYKVSENDFALDQSEIITPSLKVPESSLQNPLHTTVYPNSQELPQ